MNMKPSIQTGEFWLYLIFGLIAVWMQKKGLKVEDLAAAGKQVVDSLGGMPTVSLVLFPAFYGAKRTFLKWQQMKFETAVQVAQAQNCAAIPSVPTPPPATEPLPAPKVANGQSKL